MLQVQNLSVRYGNAQILKNVSFDLQEGQWLMIAGPNGAGKSTAIAAISQTTDYTGKVLIRGQDASKMKSSQRAKEIGVLMQKHSPGFSFTVEEVVRLGRYAYAPSPFSSRDRDDEKVFEQAVRMTGIENILHQSVLTVSGGELQRTFLAQLLNQNPRIMILDEPANHLDLKYQKQIFDVIREWLKTPGRAVVSVVHDLSLARAYGTDALLMNRGETVVKGKIGDVMKDESLSEVYEMNVREWMQGLLNQWKDA